MRLIAYLVALKWGVDVDAYLTQHTLERLAEDCAAFQTLDAEYAKALRSADKTTQQAPRPLSGSF